jgi:polar amino acid transport system substrate-binding protein
VDAQILSDLASTGTLRAGLNMANALLITGKTPDGDPDGVAPDMVREIAKKLGVGVSWVPFPTPGEVADAGADGLWDIALIGADPTRAEVMDFTAAYVEIEATYLVPAGSPFQSIDDVDADGIRIAVSGRSAYDLYLARILDGGFTTIQQAIGIQKGKEAGAKFLSHLVEDAKASGLVAQLIERHGVTGRLSVAQPG